MGVNQDDTVKSDYRWLDVTSCSCILLVDNNPASLVHTASLLQEKLYNVTTAGSAAMALKLFEAREGFYHMVMADFNMQDMNIFEFVERIHDQSLTFMPVVLMAENFTMELGEEALKKGASLVIEKPLEPSGIARLWHQILWSTRGNIPDHATSSKQRKRTLICADENGKPKKSQYGQGYVTFRESRKRKTSNMTNMHDYYQAPGHSQGHREGKSLPSNSLTTTPTRNYVGFTLEGLQQNQNELNSINMLNGTTGNGIMMYTGSRQVAGGNGGVEVFMGGGRQVTRTNGYMAGSLRVPNEEISGAQKFLGRGQVTSTNGYVTGALQVPITGALQVPITGGLHFPNQQPSGDFANVVYHNGNVMSNTGSGQVGGEIGGRQIFMEGPDQVTPTNGCVTSGLQVPNQEAVVDLGRGMYGSGNGIVMNSGSPQVAWPNGGVQIFMKGGQATSTNAYLSGSLHVPHQEPPLGNFADSVYHNGNVIRNTGSSQVAEEIAGQGTSTSPNDIAEKQLTEDDIIAELLRDLLEENII